MWTFATLMIAAFTGGAWRRWFGSGTLLPTPRAVKLGVWGLLVAAACLAASTPYWLAIFVVALTCAGWSLGHGSYIDLGRMPAPDNERAKFILDRLLGKEDKPSWIRDAAGLAITYGVWSWLVAGGMLVAGYPTIWFLLVVPIVVIIAYEIGWRIGEKHVLAIGETITGAWVLMSIDIALFH